MIKSFIKEFFIMALLLSIIFLILGILFYDYIPTNKVIPEKVAYETPTEVTEELNEQITQLEKIEISYEITDEDLKTYENLESYNPGRVNPFADLTNEDTSTDNNSDSSGSSSNNSNGSSSNDTTSNDSSNSFFDDEVK